jgi:hypothetical protein
VCLLCSPLPRPYTQIWLLIIWDSKVGPSYVISCIFMTGLWREMSHSFLYDWGVPDAEGTQAKDTLTKKVKYSAKCHLKDKKTHSVLCLILLSEEFMYQIYVNTLHSCVILQEKLFFFFSLTLCMLRNEISIFLPCLSEILHRVQVLHSYRLPTHAANRELICMAIWTCDI